MPAPIPLTQDEVALWRILEDLAGADSLLDWIPLLSRSFARPDHLRPLAQVIARARCESVYAWVSVPPRHSKTETLMHAAAWWLMTQPQDPLAYATYEADLAYSKSRRMRDLAEAAGVRLRKDARGVREWLTEQGGGLRATSVHGPLTGHGAKLLLIDDPLKNREEAESAVIRQKIWDWFTSTALTRVEPGGSVIVCHTRWHDDDLIGRIIREFGDSWIGIDLPAVTETPIEGPVEPGEPSVIRRALWPERWSLAELDKKRRLVGEYDWASLYQGMPRPKGGRLFGEAYRYEHALITERNTPYKIIISADPAATESTSADHSAIVVTAFSGKPRTLSFRGDVLEVWRGQVTVPQFVAKLNDYAKKWAAPVVVEAVGGFKAIPQILRALDKNLRVIEAPVFGDKFTRALPVAAAWNDGRLRVPHASRANPWVPDFLSEVERFTGVKDAQDDQVDALAHGFNAAIELMPSTWQIPDLYRSEHVSNLPFG